MSVITMGVRGLEAFPVFIEADIGRGIFNFNIVGLGDKAVSESRARILSAIKNSGFISPKTAQQKITILLGPADIKKEGSHFDLPVAVAYLEKCGQLKLPDTIAAFGELSLDGRVQPVKNIILMLLTAKNLGYKKILIPEENLPEVELIDGISVAGVKTLAEAVNALNNPRIFTSKITDNNAAALQAKRSNNSKEEQNTPAESFDIDTIIGQTEAKRALEIALAGKHHIAFYGPPGVGKSLLAKSSAELLPPLSKEEALEHVILRESSGHLRRNSGSIFDKEIFTPPFRDPHHTSSYSAILGTPSSLGELSLAHNGIIFMDEFAEFDRRALESLRQPMEDGYIKSHRAGKAQMAPADSILIAATNLCKCGNYRSSTKRCTCTTNSVQQYIKRISGPLADRIDIWVYMQEQSQEYLNHAGNVTAEASGAEIKKRIAAARRIQTERLFNLGGKHKNIFKNNKRKLKVLLLKNIKQNLTKEAKKSIEEAAKNLGISARDTDSVLAVARTIADIEYASNPSNKKPNELRPEHILEALTYRKKF